MNWLLGVFSWVMGRLFGKPQGPSQEAQAAKAAGIAETALAQERASNAEITKAAAAGAAIERRLGTPDKLRAFEATDPNNRDNG